MNMKTFTLLTTLFAISSSLWAQNTSTEETNSSGNSGDTKFVLTGYGYSGMTIEGKGKEQKSTFGETGFAPIFIWKASKNLFFEGEVEFILLGEGLDIELEYANVNLIMNKYMTLRAGKFLSPFGTFQEKLHPAWINKMVSKPLGFGHGAVGPDAEIGFDLRGGVPLGSSKMNYSLYVSNGPILRTGVEEENEAGMLEYGNIVDNNKNKAIGGRIGFLPFSNSSLEIGVSAQTAKGGNNDSIFFYNKKNNAMDALEYNNIGTKSYALDLSYVKSLAFIKGTLDIKGQLNNVTVDKADYADLIDSTKYSFKNVTQSYYVQLAYRPNMLRNKFFNKTELVGRYSALKSPEESKWGEEETQLTIGLNYWASWRSVIKFNYQITQNGGNESEPAILIQFVTGF